MARHMAVKAEGAAGARAEALRPAAVIVAVVLSVVRLVLAYLEPVILNMMEGVDVTLMFNEALYLSRGEWLGPYGQNTLVKNPGYPLFIAAVSKVGLPYQVAVALVIMAAAACFVWAIFPLTKRHPWVSVVVYGLIIFTPILFSRNYMERIYRTVLAYPMDMLVCTGYIGLYLRRDRGLKALLPWGVVLALAMPFFWVLKEDSVWVLPLAGVVSLLLALHWLVLPKTRRKPAAAVARVVLLCLPLVTTLGMVSAISHQNMARYGISVTNEKGGGSFARLSHDLVRIGPGDPNTDIWVSRDAMQRAIDASPTLAGMGDELMSTYDVWAQDNHPDVGDPRNLYMDLYQWVLMDAYQQAGGYTTGQETYAFWDRAATELEQAFDDGTLQEREPGLWVSGIVRPIAWDDVPHQLGATVRRVFHMLFLSPDSERRVSWVNSIGTQEDYDQAVQLFHGPVVPVEGDRPASQTFALKVAYLATSCHGPLRAAVTVLTLGLLVACIATKTWRGMAHKGDVLLMVMGLLLVCLEIAFSVSWFMNPASEASGLLWEALVSYYVGVMCCYDMAILLIGAWCGSALLARRRARTSQPAAS